MLPRMWRTHDFFGGFCFADTIGGRDILWKNIFMSDNIFEKEGGYCNSPPPPTSPIVLCVPQITAQNHRNCTLSLL